MNLQEIIEQIKTESGLTNPAQIEIMSRTITRATELGSRQLAGEDVSEELAIVKATALNLSEHVRNVALEKTLSFVQQTVTAVLTKALIA